MHVDKVPYVVIFKPDYQCSWLLFEGQTFKIFLILVVDNLAIGTVVKYFGFLFIITKHLVRYWIYLIFFLFRMKNIQRKKSDIRATADREKRAREQEGVEAQQGYANLIEDNAEDEDVLF